MDLSLIYFPSAVLLGALHALEPGHAKTLTAAYLIGTKGTKRDATILGLSVAFTHSIVVVALAVVAIFLGREAFTGEAEHYLSLGSSIVVIALGAWLLRRRLTALRRAKSFVSAQARGHSHTLEPMAVKVEQFTATDEVKFKIHEPEHHHHQGDEHDHALLPDEEHAKAHAATLPDYVARGERPTFWQIAAFGAAGGFVPCPAAISVMLLALSVNQSAKGLILVLGFGIGLAITLVGVGLIVVTGISKIAAHGRFSKFSAYAPSIAACMVMFSGAVGVAAALFHYR